MYNPAETSYEIHDLLKNRWSPRAFSNQPVETEKLLSLFEAARWSPSAANMQPWAFLFVTQEQPEAYAKLVSTLMGRNPEWAKDAPVLLVALARQTPDNPRASQIAYYDLGQSLAHLTVQAASLGLHVHQMGGFDGAKLKEVFNIPENYVPVTVSTIGYYGNAEDLAPELRERELAARTRKPLSEFVFDSEWNKAVA